MSKIAAAKAQVPALISGPLAIAQAGVHPLFEAPAPAATAVHFGEAGFGRPRVGRVPVVVPLPNVAADVVQAERAGREGLRCAGAAAVLPARAPIG